MPQREEPGVFRFDNYTLRHQHLIIMVRRKARLLRRCTICQRYPVVDTRALAHIALRSIGAEGLDGTDMVLPVALCVRHCGLSSEELADYCWPDWRGQWG